MLQSRLLFTLTLFAFGCSVAVFATDNNAANHAPQTAEQVCMESANTAAVALEAKAVQLPSDQVKGTELRSLGAGTGLFLYSVFVDSPKSADNTHWELVGEFSMKSSTCKIVLSRRYEAP